MRNGRFICRVIFFAAILSLLLGLTAWAAAEETNPCANVHQGGWRYEVTLEPTCVANGSRDKYCMACGQKIGTETINPIGHKPSSWTVVNQAATCTAAGAGQEITQCSVCRAIISVNDITINPLGHDYPSEWTVTKQPTCESTGTRQRVCRRDSSHVETQTIEALGHQWGPWAVTKQPTCEEPGTEMSVCARDSSHTQTRNVSPLGHQWGPWTVTKQPTCEESGSEKRVCARNSSHTETRTTDPLGHLWGPEVTTPSTCTTPGSVKQTCQRNSSHVKTVSTLPLDPNNHNYGPYVVTKKPTCTTKGQETSTCSYNSDHKQFREIDIVPDAHVWDGGTIIKQPTVLEEGEKLYVCTLNPDHTKTVKLDTLAMKNNTVCAFGPRLRDTNLYPYNSDEWYMFTPFDASKEGTQTYELVASNTYIVGSVSLTVKDGNLTVDYTLTDTNKFKITLEFFTVLHRINDLTQYEPEQLMSMRMEKNKPISLEENFGDDTNLVLYFCSRCDFSYSKKFLFLSYENAAHQRLLSSMLNLMD